MWATIAVGAIVLLSLVGLRFNLRTRLDREAGSTDASDQERAEALRQVSRDIEKGRSAGHGLY
jgi:hypothetical protein